MNYERLFLENLATIDQVVRAIARRYHLPQDETEDLLASIHLKIVENDYEILRRFEQRSSLRTYLTVIVQRHFLDARMACWGKWRPCREARRSGPVAVLLDRLLTRDGLSFDEACEVLRTNHGVTATRDELYALSVLLPVRTGRRFLGDDQLVGVPADDLLPDQMLEASLADDEAVRREAALRAAVARLSAPDRLLLKLRFRDGHRVSQIARLLGLEQKPLYRRLEQVMKVLRAELEARGLGREKVQL